MATNFEFYKDEILTKVSPLYNTKCIFNSFNLALGEKFGKECNCTSGVCADSVQELIEWLYAEHIEQPKLTKRERAFCEAVQTGWIARNPNGLFWFRDEPKRAVSIIWNSDKYKNISDFEIGFEFIKCADEKPWAVEDLLKLEVEE